MQAPHEFAARLYLWQGEALFVGSGLTSTLHRHHAVQIGISFGAAFGVREQPNQPFTACMGFIAPSHIAHQVHSAGIPSLFVWIESESATASAILEKYSAQAVTFLSNDVFSRIASQFDRNLPISSCHDASAAVARVHESLGIEKMPLPPMDARIQRILELTEPIHRMNAASLAASVYLSPSRLRHLFQAQIGISIQRYLLWQKLLTALSQAANGTSLTQAAHDARFSDSAHFSRTFRQMFGVKPSEIFGNSHRVQVNAC